MNLQTSILKTIAFFDLFDFPLTAEEVKMYLYHFSKPVHIKEVKGVLGEMEEVEKIHDYYVLKGRGKLADIRRARKFIAEKLWARTRQYGQYIAQVPFVRMVAVCNNLAYDNPTEQSDIDLFIVIREGRMWLARLWITLILQFFGVRRHGHKIVGRFCLSFFVIPSRLCMEPLLLKPEDPYLAYWTLLLRPLCGEKTYREFIEKNRDWLNRDYGLKFSENSGTPLTFHDSRFKHFWEWALGGTIGNWIEALLKKTFKKRTLNKAKKLPPTANVMVTDDMLKFHNHDRRREYFERWEKAISSIVVEQ